MLLGKSSKSKAKTHKIRFGFIQREDDEDLGWFDKKVSDYIQSVMKDEFTHVEITNEEGTSYSISRGQKVHKEKKTMKRQGYRFFEIDVTKKQYMKTFSYLEKQFHNKKDFNYLGYYWNFTLGPYTTYIDRKGSHFFCSELISHALIAGGIIDANDIKAPYLTKPDDIRDYFGSSVVISDNYNEDFMNQSETKKKYKKKEIDEDDYDDIQISNNKDDHEINMTHLYNKHDYDYDSDYDDLDDGNNYENKKDN